MRESSSPPTRGDMAWLEYCCEEALDAYTLDDALMWHKEIATELTRRIALVSEANWPTDIKTRTLFDIMHRRAIHSACIHHAEAALRRNENIKWKA
ncbi:MAG: hypothetical protein JSR89_12820 [Proteobacteria bacterium]|nr:hypothetical protein [Pseudomonadota bacterium]